MKTRIKTIREHEGELENINASLKSIKRAIETLPKTNIDSLERIKLTEREKKKKVKLWKKLLIFIVPMLITYILYVIIYPTSEFQENSNTIKGFIKYPLLVFPYDEENIDLTLINTSDKNNVEEIKSLLTYPRQEFIKIVSNNGSSVTQFDALDIGESKTKTIKFRLNKPVCFKKIELTVLLKLKIKNKTVPDIVESYSILLIPIPYARSFIMGCFIFLGNFLLTLVSKKLTDRWKEK